jgi:hypothetical protein
VVTCCASHGSRPIEAGVCDQDAIVGHKNRRGGGDTNSRDKEISRGNDLKGQSYEIFRILFQYGLIDLAKKGTTNGF